MVPTSTVVNRFNTLTCAWLVLAACVVVLTGTTEGEKTRTSVSTTYSCCTPLASVTTSA